LFTAGDGELERLEIADKFALAYRECGQSQEALSLYEKVLKARKRIRGGEHLGTLTSVGNLASSYDDLGRMQEAVELFEKGLQASERVIGEETSRTLSSMNNIAGSYHCLDRVRGAKKLGGCWKYARGRLVRSTRTL
jgi:tetratricopeptide (TPR) repeat protein